MKAPRRSSGAVESPALSGGAAMGRELPRKKRESSGARKKEKQQARRKHAGKAVCATDRKIVPDRLVQHGILSECSTHEDQPEFFCLSVGEERFCKKAKHACTRSSYPGHYQTDLLNDRSKSWHL